MKQWIKTVQIVVILIILLNAKCSETKTQKRVLITNGTNSNNNSNVNGSFDVNIGAGYGVQSSDSNHTSITILTPPPPPKQPDRNQSVGMYVEQVKTRPVLHPDSLPQSSENQIVPTSYQVEERSGNTAADNKLYNIINQKRRPLPNYNNNIVPPPSPPRPNLREIHNVLNTVERTNHNPSKIVEVVRVPAVYELHLQSDRPNYGAQRLTALNPWLGNLINFVGTNVRTEMQPPPMIRPQPQQQYYYPAQQQYEQQEYFDTDNNNYYHQQNDDDGLNDWRQQFDQQQQYLSPSNDMAGIIYVNIPQKLVGGGGGGSHNYLNNQQNYPLLGQDSQSVYNTFYTTSSIPAPANTYLDKDVVVPASTILKPQMMKNGAKYLSQSNHINKSSMKNLWTYPSQSTIIAAASSDNPFFKKPQAIHEVPAPNLNKYPPPTFATLMKNAADIQQFIYGGRQTPSAPPPTLSTVLTALGPLHYIKGPLDDFKIKPLQSTTRYNNNHHDGDIIFGKPNVNDQRISSNFYQQSVGLPSSSHHQQQLFLIKNNQVNDLNTGAQTFDQVRSSNQQQFVVNKALENYLNRDLSEEVSTQEITRLSPATIEKPIEKNPDYEVTDNNLPPSTNLNQFQVQRDDNDNKLVENNNSIFPQHIVPNLNVLLSLEKSPIQNNQFENQIPANVVRPGGQETGDSLDGFDDGNKFESMRINHQLMGAVNENGQKVSSMAFGNEKREKYYDAPKFVPTKKFLRPRPFSRNNRRSGAPGGGGRRPTGGYVIYINERTID